jgi:hypothetical protein
MTVIETTQLRETFLPDIRITIAERDMELHRPIPTFLRRWLGLGSHVCIGCGAKWGGRGCQIYRDARALLITHAARVRAATPSLRSARPAAGHYRLRRPVGSAEYRSRTA